MGNIKAKNEWLHKVKWDIVVFDEYHFGAWRDSAKELFEGEDAAVVKVEAKLEADLGAVNEDLEVLSEARRFHTELVLLQSPDDGQGDGATNRVLRESQCPVLVIPSGDNARLMDTR